jgi:hypothetical protein
VNKMELARDGDGVEVVVAGVGVLVLVDIPGTGCGKFVELVAPHAEQPEELFGEPHFSAHSVHGGYDVRDVLERVCGISWDDGILPLLLLHSDDVFSSFSLNDDDAVLQMIQRNANANDVVPNDVHDICKIHCNYITSKRTIMSAQILTYASNNFVLQNVLCHHICACSDNTFLLSDNTFCHIYPTLSMVKIVLLRDGAHGRVRRHYDRVTLHGHGRVHDHDRDRVHDHVALL